MAHPFACSQNTVQRIFQSEGWQVHKTNRLSATGAGTTIDDDNSRLGLGNRLVLRIGGARWLGGAGAGH